MEYLGIMAFVSLMLALILLIHMIQQAFEREGVIWGLITVIFPAGTYLYCRRRWEQEGKSFWVISGLTLFALVGWLLVRWL